MLHSKRDKMKCPCYEAIKASNMEKSSESKVLHLKPSPVKELTPIKAQCSPAEVAKVLFSIKDTSAVHDKENSTGREHDHSLDESFEDSGYLSKHNSQNHSYHGEEEDDYILGKPAAPLPSVAAAQQEKTMTPTNSPSKCQGRNNYSRPTSLVAVSTPVDCSRRTPAAYSLSSTPSDPHSDPNLPILMFQRAVCEELAKSYKKNNKYDWSIVTKVAEDHLLDRVIGGQMGLEYIDIFTSLLSRNMRSVLTNILALLGDMDLISCKKVSRTWRKIICEDTAVLSRCRQAEQALRESRSSLSQTGCGLTRDVAVSRVVLSCMQTLAFSNTPSSSSSTPSCRTSRRTAPPQKSNTTNSQCTRFDQYIQAASSLKQHESLRHCKRCGSPATHSPEVQQAVCTRCLFNFCTRCQETFHGSTPCRTVQPRLHVPTSKKTLIVPGTKRSIRRL
ncbi:F-box only protein 5 [Amphiprion ocellaris]|uniref:ZBR-type domain-containing protein n=1 Tax=Amphiprion ocellaris TaxID=80972 RepID=A0A3Q1B802_AMPOC|nr:F-box only protein 5 [Amphiprion ocellaris]